MDFKNETPVVHWDVTIPGWVPQGVHFLSVNASSFSAFCGRHKYKGWDEAFVEVLERNRTLLAKVERALDEEDLTYKPLLASLGVSTTGTDQTPTELAKDVLARPDAVGAQARHQLATATPPTDKDLQELRKKRPKLAELVTQTQRQIQQTAAYQQAVQTTVLNPQVQEGAAQSTGKVVGNVVRTQKLDDQTKRQLEKKTQHTWLKDRGTALEAAAEEAIVTACPPKCHVEKQRCALIKIKVNGGQMIVHVPCKMDVVFVADDDDNDDDHHHQVAKVAKVFEIKNRRNRFFVPTYDVDQLCLYIVATHARDGGTLVERCQGQERQSKHVSLVEATAYMQEQLLPAMRVFLPKFVDAVHQPMAKEHYTLWQSLRGNSTVSQTGK